MSYDLSLVIWSLLRLLKSLDYPFPWTRSWEMTREAHLKDSRNQIWNILDLRKNIFWASKKSTLGPKRQISESYELNLAIWGFSGWGTHLTDHFSGICHGKCGLRWIWSILDSRKIYFGPLESQFGVRKKPILVSYELNCSIWGLFRLENFGLCHGKFDQCRI